MFLVFLSSILVLVVGRSTERINAVIYWWDETKVLPMGGHLLTT